MISVPNVVDSQKSAAIVKLKAAGLQGVVGTSVEDSSPAGTVLSQDPTAGSNVEPGTVVTLKLSSGPAAPSETPTSTPTESTAPSNENPNPAPDQQGAITDRNGTKKPVDKTAPPVNQ